MITKIGGQLAALHGDTLTLKIDAFEYEALIPAGAIDGNYRANLASRSACTRSNAWKATRCKGG